MFSDKQVYTSKETSITELFSKKNNLSSIIPPVKNWTDLWCLVNNLPKSKNKLSGGVSCFQINRFIPPTKLPIKSFFQRKITSSITPPVKEWTNMWCLVNNLPKSKNKLIGGVACFQINRFKPPKNLPFKSFFQSKITYHPLLR